MKKYGKIWIFVLAFLSLLILYFALFYQEKKRFDWTEDYVLDKDKPYGTWLISELLKEYDQDRKFSVLSSPIDRSLTNPTVKSLFLSAI